MRDPEAGVQGQSEARLFRTAKDVQEFGKELMLACGKRVCPATELCHRDQADESTA
jgi:hypothetical protein